MADLIDRIDTIVNFGFQWDDISPTREEVVEFLKNQKGIDAVPVVRCKDCILKGMCCHHNGRFVGQFSDDDFCSYGERREDSHE